MKNNESFWEEGAFIQSISSEEVEEKMKTLHDEEDNKKFKCKKCGKSISAHNKDWHDCMCDDCFNKTYFSA
ncbi:MAG: hypothetical protein AABX88_00495 [Nanoarchaeota archaeon]